MFQKEMVYPQRDKSYTHKTIFFLMMMFSKGSFKKYVTRLGKRGVAKKMTKCGIGGGGLRQRVMSLIKKNISKMVY